MHLIEIFLLTLTLVLFIISLIISKKIKNYLRINHPNEYNEFTTSIKSNYLDRMLKLNLFIIGHPLLSKDLYLKNQIRQVLLLRTISFTALTTFLFLIFFK
jgi:hypothetical protein